MIRRLLIIITTILFIFQIGFSAYYSSDIISENTKFEQNSEYLQKTSLIHQQLVYQLSTLASLDHLSRNTPPNLQPIRLTLDLSNE